MKTCEIKSAIRIVENFPQKGVSFLDIASVLEQPAIFKMIVDKMADKVMDKEIDKIVALDARGFLFAAALAYKLAIPIVMARKKGKLPGMTVSCIYGLEYGRNELEIQATSIKAGDKVVVVDDVLATGGTAKTAVALSEQLGGVVKSLIFFAEISELAGRDSLANKKVYSIIEF